MSPATQFLIGQRIAPAVINFLINGLIAWFLHRSTPQLRLWGEGGYAFDLMLTAALISSITWLVLLPMLQKQAATGKAPVLTGVPRPALERLIPNQRWPGFWASFALGLVVCGGFTALALTVLGAPAISGADFAWFKGAFSAMVAFVMQPALVFAALRQPPVQAAAAA